MGWLYLLLLLAATVGVLWLLGLRGGLLQLTGAALLFGAAGYAWQGRPDLAGSTASAAAKQPAIPLTRLRHAFYGQFTSSEMWMRLSEGRGNRGDLAGAAAILQTAVRRHPRDPQLWIGFGNALVDQAGTLTPPAQLAYQRANELTPDYPAPRFFFGLALARSGQAPAAIALWRDVLADAPAEASWRPLVEDAILALERPQAGS